MGELEKYGLLSLASIAVLFLVLTFVRRDTPHDLRASSAAAASRDAAEPVVASGEKRPSPRAEPSQDEPKGPHAASPGDDESSRPRAEVPRVPVEPVDAATVGRRRDAYVIAKGDTLSSIAARYLGSARRWPEIVAANGRLDPQTLQIGQVIRLPAAAPLEPPETAPVPRNAPVPERAAPKPAGRATRPSANEHTVVDGDTLSNLAQRYYKDARQWLRIYRENRARIPDADRLTVGTILRLP